MCSKYDSKIKDELNQHNYDYYVDIYISDFEFDLKLKELQS
jgi:NAD-dependent DNA ligase